MKTKSVRFSFPGGEHITVKPGSVRSNLKYPNPAPASLQWEFNAAIDGIESLLLALASAGVDLSTSEYHQAVEIAVETVTAQFS